MCVCPHHQNHWAFLCHPPVLLSLAEAVWPSGLSHWERKWERERIVGCFQLPASPKLLQFIVCERVCQQYTNRVTERGCCQHPTPWLHPEVLQRGSRTRLLTHPALLSQCRPDCWVHWTTGAAYQPGVAKHLVWYYHYITVYVQLMKGHPYNSYLQIQLQTRGGREGEGGSCGS